MHRIVFTALLLLGWVFPTDALATVSVTVLDLESGRGGNQVAKKITSLLRKQVSNTNNLRIVGGKTLMEVKLIFGCSERPRRAYYRCLARAGASLKANRVLVGRVFVQGSDYKVVLTLIDVKRPLRPQTVSEQLSAAQAQGAALETQVKTWFGTLFGQSLKGFISITCQPDGVSVSIGGQQTATCGSSPARVALKPGSHNLSFSKSGFTTTQRMVSVQAGRTSPLRIELSPGRRVEDGRPPPRRPDYLPPKKGPKKRRDSRVVWQALFYTTVGAGAALLIGSIFTGLKVKSIQDDKVEMIEYSRNPDGSDTDPPPRIEAGPDQDACAEGADKGYTALVNTCNRGIKYANITNAFIGVGAGLVALSGWFLYKGFIAKPSTKERPDKETESRRQTSPVRFRLTPQIGPTGGGLSATIEF